MLTDNTKRAVITHLIEEASEVIQEASKIDRFGVHSYHPDEPELTNRQRLRAELVDLRAMIEIAMAEIVMLEERDALTEEEISDRIDSKYKHIMRESYVWRD